jgi:hypothetical protein
MRYQFVDEIVSLALDGIERTPIARATLMFVCFAPPAGDPARGARA